MGRARWVDESQVMAARLVIKLDLEDGREPDPLAVKIVNAKRVDRLPTDEEIEAEERAEERAAEQAKRTDQAG